MLIFHSFFTIEFTYHTLDKFYVNELLSLWVLVLFIESIRKKSGRGIRRGRKLYIEKCIRIYDAKDKNKNKNQEHHKKKTMINKI